MPLIVDVMKIDVDCGSASAGSCYQCALILPHMSKESCFITHLTDDGHFIDPFYEINRGNQFLGSDRKGNKFIGLHISVVLHVEDV